MMYRVATGHDALYFREHNSGSHMMYSVATGHDALYFREHNSGSHSSSEGIRKTDGIYGRLSDKPGPSTLPVKPSFPFLLLSASKENRKRIQQFSLFQGHGIIYAPVCIALFNQIKTPARETKTFA